MIQMNAPKGMDLFKIVQTNQEIGKLDRLIDRERDKFKLSDLKQERTWHRRKLIFYQGGRAK